MFLQKQSHVVQAKIPKALVLEASPHSTSTHQDWLQDVQVGAKYLLSCIQFLPWQAAKLRNFLVTKLNHLFYFGSTTAQICQM